MASSTAATAAHHIQGFTFCWKGPSGSLDSGASSRQTPSSGLVKSTLPGPRDVSPISNVHLVVVTAAVPLPRRQKTGFSGRPRLRCCEDRVMKQLSSPRLIYLAVYKCSIVVEMPPVRHRSESVSLVCEHRPGHFWLGFVRSGGRFGSRIGDFRPDPKQFSGPL